MVTLLASLPFEMLSLFDQEYQVLVEEYLESEKKNKKEKKSNDKKEKAFKKGGKKFLYASRSTELIIEHKCIAFLFQISHWETPHITKFSPPPKHFSCSIAA